MLREFGRQAAAGDDVLSSGLLVFEPMIVEAAVAAVVAGGAGWRMVTSFSQGICAPLIVSKVVPSACSTPVTRPSANTLDGTTEPVLSFAETLKL